MASVAGDVGVVVTTQDQQAVAGVSRVIRSLDELGVAAKRNGDLVDKALAHLEKTSAAVEGIHQITKAQQEEAAAARAAAEAQRKLQEEQRKAAQAAQEHKRALENTRQGLAQVGTAAAAMAAALALAAREFLDAFKQQQSAMLGLEAVATRTVGSFAEAKAAAQSLADDGLMSVVEASKAVQAGLASGFSLDETMNVIKTFKDSAAFNRQAGLDFGEAVVRAMEGVRMGNSILSDAAGITKNLSQILKEAGFAEQDLMRVSSDAAVRRALYNGLLREGTIFAGNAAKAMETLAGAEAKAGTSAFYAKAAFGEALAPALQSVYSAMGPLLTGVTTWVKTNPELARTLFLVAGGATAFMGAVTLLAAAVLAFHAALGPVGWALAGISAGMGALIGYGMSVKATGDAAQRTQNQVNDLVSEYDRLREAVNDTALSEADHKKAVEELNRVLEQLEGISPDLVKGWHLQRDAVVELNGKLQESIDKANKWKATWLGIRMGLGAAAYASGNTTWGEILLPPTEPKPEGPNVDDALIALAKANRIKPRDINTDDDDDDDDGGGDGKMSAKLTAAMEYLQDLQAMEKSPENLRKVLAQVETILRDHNAELVKLGKDSDLKRMRDIILPQDIEQAVQRLQAGEYNKALEQVNADKTLKGLTPQQIRERLEGIRKQFTDFLTKNPQEALQLDLRIKGATDDEIRAPLEAWQKTFRENDRMGFYDNDPYLKFKALQSGLGLAIGAGDMGAISDLVGQIGDLNAAIQQAGFDREFGKIAKAREEAFGKAAPKLAGLEKDLIDAEAAGDTGTVAKIKQQMLDLVRPALEAQRDALQKIVDDTSYTAEQRAEAERVLNSVLAELRQQDVDGHRIASEAKVAADHKAADERAKLVEQEQSWIRQLAEADMKSLRERNAAAEKAEQARVKGLQDQLSALERLWAAEDRREGLADLKAQLAAVKADTRFQKVDANGNLVYTYDEERARELEGQIQDKERDDDRARQRESLQDQIKAAQDSLAAMQTSHQTQEAERQRFWQAIESMDISKFDDLTKAAATGLDAWIKVLNEKLPEMTSAWETAAAKVKAAAGLIAGLGTPSLNVPVPAMPQSATQASANLAALATAASGVNVDTMQIYLPNVTDAAGFVQQAPGAIQSQGDIRSVVRAARTATQTR